MKKSFNTKQSGNRKSYFLFLLVAVAAVSVSAFLQSCQSWREDEDSDEEKSVDTSEFLKKGSEQNQNKKVSIQDEQVLPEQVEAPDISKEQLQRLEKAQKAHEKSFAKADKISPFYADFIIMDADEKIDVSLAFNSAPILDVLQAFADALKFNYVADPDLKGVVTVNINSSMTKEQLWHTFDKMVSLAGAAVVADDTLFRVLPLSKLAQQPDIVMPQGIDPEVLYVQLHNSTAKEVVTQIKPFLGPNSVCVELTSPNAVLISDERSNIPKLKQLLEIVDWNGKVDWPRAVMTCSNILPSQIVTELQNILPVLGFYVQKTTDKTTQPGAIQLTSVDRLQIVVASAATEEATNEIRHWVEILDNATSLDEERVFVYKVRHGKSDQLARALAVVYNLSGQSLTIDTSSGNNKIETISASASSTAVSRTTTNNNNNNANRTTNTQTSQSSNIFEKPVRLFADGVLNRLVIRTTPRTYASIKAVLDKLDIVPAQVLLQVLLVEVTLTESDNYGVEFSGTGSWNGNDIVYGNFFDNMSKIDTNGGGTFYISDPNDSNRKAYIRALAGNNLLKVVAKPQLLVSSHKQAVINVGAQVPIKTQSMTSTTSENVVNSVDYKDTGIILTVTPQVTSTDLISLDLKQEYSEAVVNGTSDIDSPEITNRVLETTMTIKNGCTMIIGGMIQEKKKDNLDSLPLIRSIPFLRRVFGNTSASEKRTELLLLITGYIVDEKCDIEEMVKRYNSAVKALESSYSKKKAKEEAKDIFGAFKK